MTSHWRVLYRSRFLSVKWNLSIIKMTKNTERERGERKKRGGRAGKETRQVKGRGEGEQGNGKRTVKEKREGEPWAQGGDATGTQRPPLLHTGCAELPHKTWTSSKAPQAYPGKNSDTGSSDVASVLDRRQPPPRLSQPVQPACQKLGKQVCICFNG